MEHLFIDLLSPLTLRERDFRLCENSEKIISMGFWKPSNKNVPLTTFLSGICRLTSLNFDE